MLSVFNSLTPYSYKTGGRIPKGWTYYTDSGGIHFNTSANLITAKGRYVSFWRTKVSCYNVAGQIIPVPMRSRSKTTCRTTSSTITTNNQICINGRWQIECSSENGSGCHGGIARNYLKVDPDFELPYSPETSPPCCAEVGGCNNCEPEDWTNWRATIACLPKHTQLCIYYDCCDHSCDRAIFEGVYYIPQVRLGRNPDGTQIISEAKREVFLTANLNNGDDGGPRGPFCATIPAGTLASWSTTKTISKSECTRQQITEAGYSITLPATSECSDSEFSVVIDVKDEGQTLTASGTYEGGFDAEPSGIVFYTSFTDSLPSPSPLGKAMLNLYQGANIRRAGWESTKFIQNNGGFFNITGCTTSSVPVSSSPWESFDSLYTYNPDVPLGGYYTFTFKQKIGGGTPSFPTTQFLRFYITQTHGSTNPNFGVWGTIGLGSSTTAYPLLVSHSSSAVDGIGHQGGYVPSGTGGAGSGLSYVANALAWNSIIYGTPADPDNHYMLHRITGGVLNDNLTGTPPTMAKAQLELRVLGIPDVTSLSSNNLSPTYVKDFTFTRYPQMPINSLSHVSIAPDPIVCLPITEDDMRAGDWQSFGASADASALTCKSLDTYNEPKIGYDEELWAGSGVQYGDNAQPRVLSPSAGHNGRKIDSIRNRFAFNFTHTLPPSTKTRKLYTHILTERVFQNKLSALFAEDFLKVETETQPASKVYFVYGTDLNGNQSLEGFNDVTHTFNSDSLFSGNELAYNLATPYKHIWHDHINPFKITSPINLPSNLSSSHPPSHNLGQDATEIFIPANARTMPFKREITIENVEIVKIFILIPPREVPTTLYCSASSFIDKTAPALNYYY